jgi:hypothetical protein
MPSNQMIEEMIENALLKGAPRAVIEMELERQAQANGQPCPSTAEINEAHAQIVERWIADSNQDEKNLRLPRPNPETPVPEKLRIE